MTIRRWALAILAVFAGWLGVMTLVMVLSDAAPGAIVLFPAPGFVTQLPDGVAIVDDGAFWIALRAQEGQTGLGVRLYQAGGRLVLPAGLPGCLPLPGAAVAG